MGDLVATFGKGAAAYNRARSDYPDELIEDIISFGGLTSKSKILEIGCGTGQATLSFAQRGFNILALDPGEQTIEILRERSSDFPNVSLETTSFEDFSSERDSFDLILSAQAFHWVDPKIASPKVASLLRDGGHVALF